MDAGPPLDRYRLFEQLGSGGSAVVFAAYDSRLRRKVALKLLSAGDGEEALREARAMASLCHPNVLPVYDCVTGADACYLTMPLVEGSTLHDWVARPHPPEEIVRAMIAAGKGLAAAHAAGLVHRDFKPTNVLVCGDGSVKVADFGLATPARRAAGGSGPDGDERDAFRGAQLGTAPYMSPEEELGRAVDARSDQFSFCASLYEVLTRQRLFVSTTAARTPAAEVAGRLALLGRRGVRGRVRRVIARGLSFEPDRRYRSMDELLVDLERALDPPLSHVLLTAAALATSLVAMMS